MLVQAIREAGHVKTRVTVWAIVRILGALTILAAVTHQFSVTLGNGIKNTPADIPTVVMNFFSFFTIESNVFAAIALLVAGVWALRHRDEEMVPYWIQVMLVLAATYMIVTGLVYNVLLRGVELPQGVTVLWANEVLHVVGPVLMLLEVLFAPRRRSVKWSTLWLIVLFPVVWIVYTLIRGTRTTNPVTGDPWWYPYPFLNPHIVGGYGAVTVYIVAIAAAVLLIGVLTVWAARFRVVDTSSRRGVTH